MTDFSWLRGGFHALAEAECWEALTSKPVGRVAFNGVHGVEVLPVNYTVCTDHSIVFRTAPYNTIATHVPRQVVAFENDDIDEFQQAGWSVLVHGQGDVLAPDDSPGPLPEPWPEGMRSLLIRIRPARISGRRVLGH